MASEDWPKIIPLAEDDLPVIGQTYSFTSESLPYDFSLGAEYDTGIRPPNISSSPCIKNILRPRQNGLHFTDDDLKCNFLVERHFSIFLC